MDIDDFKKINDTLGHVVGDETLKTVAVRLSQSVRDSDTVARLAGDEFMIILDNLRTIDDVEIISNKIAKNLAEPIDFLPQEFMISVSIGISLFPKHGKDADRLIKKADSAMYIVKSKGKNDYLIYSK